MSHAYVKNTYTLLTRIEVLKIPCTPCTRPFSPYITRDFEYTVPCVHCVYLVCTITERGRMRMREQLNDLLVKIQRIAIEENIVEIICYVDKINELLGDNYEIYKLSED